jgi:hypothetical protein
MRKLGTRVLLWTTLASLLLARTPLVRAAKSAELTSPGPTRSPDFIIDFSGYTGGSLDHWLGTKGFKLEKVSTIRIEWGVIQYPQASYARKVNNEALMLYVFFGRERVSSGSVFIPDGPYFIGLFLCDDGQVNFPYKGQYFHTGGRFVCLGQPKPNETIVSEFDLGTAFKRYFGKNMPDVTGIGLGVDTSAAGRNGTAGAFIKSIEFIEGERAAPNAAAPGGQ